MVILESATDPKLVTLLQTGAVGIMPTDTIYGLVATARDPAVVRRLYKLKERERKPGTIIAAHVDQLVALGIDRSLLRRVAHLWPNPLSIVLSVSAELSYLDQAVGSLAVRVPQDETIRALLAQTGPLVTSSANHPGHVPASNMIEAQRVFGDQVDFYVAGDDRGDRPPSTVVRLRSDGQFELLRRGAVTIDEQGNIHD